MAKTIEISAIWGHFSAVEMLHNQTWQCIIAYHNHTNILKSH